MKLQILKESFDRFLEAEEKRLSNCCSAPPLDGHIDKDVQGGRDVYIGRCSKCKEGAEFLTQSQLDAEGIPPIKEHHEETLRDSTKDMRVGELLSILEKWEGKESLYKELEEFLGRVEDEDAHPDREHGQEEDDGQPSDSQEHEDFAQDDDWHNMSAADMYEAKKSKKPLLKKGKFEKIEKKEEKKGKKPEFLKKFDKKGKK